MRLTERSIAALAYLDDKMEANMTMIGEAIIKAIGSNSRYPGQVAGGVVIWLYSRGLVSMIPELRAYRITAAGREELRKSKLGADSK